MSESKPFPKPPFQNNREMPFGNPDPVMVEEDPRLKDDDVRLIFKTYLIPEHFKSEKILRFILAYCTCRNASQAQRESGLSGSGAYWRSRPDIHSCIEAITQRAIIKYGYDSHDVVERVKEIADVDPVEFQNPDGSWKTHLREIRPEVRRAIKKMKVKNIYGEDANGMRIVTGQIIDFELWDKMKANEMLGPEKNVFKKTTVVTHDVTENMKEVLLESNNRAEERLKLMASREVVEHGEGETGSSGEGWDRDGISVGESSGQGIGDGPIGDE